MMTLLRTVSKELRGALAPIGAQPKSNDIFCARERAHSLSAVLIALVDQHGQDFDALAAELGVPADVDLLHLSFEAARVSAARVNFTTIAPCLDLLRAAAAGRVFGRGSREPVHNFDRTSLEPTGPTYRVASRALEEWFLYCGGVITLFPDFTDGKSWSSLRPLMEQYMAEARQS
jgi:hypothetical protein